MVTRLDKVYESKFTRRMVRNVKLSDIKKEMKKVKLMLDILEHEFNKRMRA